ncbi:enhancer of mRNA-decapping protein 4 isoform X2 [Tribolium castaneum]|uniref:enhancer of mRNA-decapping protein 4 isoform X2 n=1 Tax=Tribolium castaneum TaxID=7070 RepID=UPI00046C1B01|nr:PREDICTED: enhancer of mRNA-decapping protein 4 isoform X2 [Tribolium castaneum]|eukprot:XP_008200206.1 PREDICTED: enhancer of mRNA-decapping protein 4 isoform X2 [Tribolium castaneum]
MNSPPLAPQDDVIQNIYTDSDTEYSAKIVGHEVTVQCNSGQHNHGSSKVKLINRIDYNWEFHYYRGQLVAVHINGKIIAYGMKGKDGGMIRVTNQETNERALIKNLKNDVKDLSFAFSRQQIILGCIDDEGNVFIYEIIDEPSAIKYKQLLHIFHSDVVPHSSPNFRIIWCPYLTCFDEEEETPDDPEKMFVVLNWDKAEIWNFGMINAKYGPGPLQPNENYEGYVEISHTAELVDASFSSDGTAIAIACLDGYVKFFQIYMVDNEKQKCLHEWRPHDGKPLSSIIFVDNLLECSSQCWKFTITGANHNSELKLWSCETWTCLQTIHFKPDPSNLIQSVYLKMSIDYSGQYLLMSDLNNKVLYVLQLKRSDEAQQISVTMISQFLLPTAFLSFHITEANCRKLRSSDMSEEFSQDADQDDDDEDDTVAAVVIKMLVIQQKKFQECNIVFQPDAMLCNTEIIFNEIKEELEKVPKLDDLQSSVTLLIKQQQQQQLTLMTPDAFTTAEQNSRPNSVRTSINGDINKSTEGTNGDTVENLIDFQRPEKDNFASGGSSPSREVQEILSLNNSTYSTQDYFDNLTKMQEEQEIPQKEYKHNENLMYQENPNPEMVWLKLPLVKKDNEINKEDNLRLGGGDEITNLNETEWDKNQWQAINFRLTSIENAISDQNVIIQKIHQELKSLNQTKQGLSEDFNKELDLTMSKQQLQIAKMLENLINMQKNNDRDQQDHVIASVSQIVVKSVSDKLQNIVAHEMKHVVVPTIRNLVETLKHQLDVQNSQKLNSDMVLQDKISKIINSKALAESLSLSVANVITPILEKCYRDMITSTLVPSWEKVCGNMFHQINETFTQGTKEYTASVEHYMERQRRVQERGKDLIVQMQSVSENLQMNTDKLVGTLSSEIHKQFNTSMKHTQENLLQSMKDLISEQIKLGFKSHASFLEDSVINAVRSRAVTPSPHVESQVTLAHLDHLLAKESYDEAFQLALSAENLNYVIYVCEKVDSNILFHGSSPPPQNCILALIQQLSMELHKNTEIKLSYIRAALVALIPGYPHTRQFIPKVLKDLLKQLQLFMTTNPSSKFITEAKLLKMAVESILDK